MENRTAYDLEGVSYSYLGRFDALCNVDLKIEEAERIALLGANGSGKSTLLSVLAGLVYPQSGTVKFYGRHLREESFTDHRFRKDFRSRVGIVFQNSDIQLFNSTVRDELLFGLAQLKLDKDMVDARIGRYGELMGIGGLMGRHPQNLSIGEKKRVAIASVLVMEPRIILLDEPTSGLDPRTVRHLIDGLFYSCERVCTVITATQDIHIVNEVANRVVVLGEDKRVAAEGPAQEIMSDNAFLEKHNLVHAHAHKHKDTVHTHPHEHPTHDHPHL